MAEGISDRLNDVLGVMHDRGITASEVDVTDHRVTLRGVVYREEPRGPSTVDASGNVVESGQTAQQIADSLARQYGLIK